MQAYVCFLSLTKREKPATRKLAHFDVSAMESEDMVTQKQKKLNATGRRIERTHSTSCPRTFCDMFFGVKNIKFCFAFSGNVRIPELREQHKRHYSEHGRKRGSSAGRHGDFLVRRRLRRAKWRQSCCNLNFRMPDHWHCSSSDGLVNARRRMRRYWFFSLGFNWT